jgi:hypothetical protein
MPIAEWTYSRGEWQAHCLCRGSGFDVNEVDALVRRDEILPALFTSVGVTWGPVSWRWRADDRRLSRVWIERIQVLSRSVAYLHLEIDLDWAAAKRMRIPVPERFEQQLVPFVDELRARFGTASQPDE